MTTMKNKKYAIMLAVTMLACFGTMAQQPWRDSLQQHSATPQYDEVIESHGNLRFDSRVPTSHNSAKSYGEQNDNNHQNTYSANYSTGNGDAFNLPSTCNWFLEGKIIYPVQVGLGLQAAYVPRHWGGYASLMQSDGFRTFYDERGTPYDELVTNTWLTGGAVFRPSLNPWLLDIQLFGGIAVGDGGGTEFGIRLGGLENSQFSWFSSSFSVINTVHGTYFTMGLSIGVTALLCIPVFIL